MIKAFLGLVILLWLANSFIKKSTATSSANDIENMAERELKQTKEKKCRQNIDCMSKKQMSAASVYCGREIEKLSKYSFKWADGFILGKFSLVQWYDKSKGQITFIGDKLQFQNGFGAWENIIYECSFDASTNKTLNIKVKSGRLP